MLPKEMLLWVHQRFPEWVRHIYYVKWSSTILFLFVFTNTIDIVVYVYVFTTNTHTHVRMHLYKYINWLKSTCRSNEWKKESVLFYAMFLVGCRSSLFFFIIHILAPVFVTQAQFTSFGPSGLVILHLLEELELLHSTPVVTIDTLHLFNETYELHQKVSKHTQHI